MQIRDRQKQAKLQLAITIISFVVVFVLLVGGMYYFMQHQGAKKPSVDTQNSKTTQPNKPSDKNTSENNDANEPSKSNNTETPNKTPKRYEGASVQNSPTLTGQVDIIGANEHYPGKFLVRVTIFQLVNDDKGVCKLTLTGPQGQTYTDTAKLSAEPQTSSCRGWDVPLDKLGNIKGRWTATVELTGDGRTGTLKSERVL